MCPAQGFANALRDKALQVLGDDAIIYFELGNEPAWWPSTNGVRVRTLMGGTCTAPCSHRIEHCLVLTQLATAGQRHDGARAVCTAGSGGLSSGKIPSGKQGDMSGPLLG
jgi:hypothetical protein